jgi:beta-phosphoglucomutase-like phosphatase (HAD superfamily)
VVIFDCNGVLVDSEPLVSTVVSQEFMRAGFALTPDVVARYFTGRRAADIFAEVENVAGRKLPQDFADTPNCARTATWCTRSPGCAARNAWPPLPHTSASG